MAEAGGARIMTKAAKQRRRPAAQSRADLIAATIECLIAEGAAGLSARKISSRAGVSVGLIHHHFSSINELAAVAYESLAEDFNRRTWAASDAATPSDDPRAQLSAFVEASMAIFLGKRESLRTWLVFWNLSDTTPQVQEVHDRLNGALWARLEGLFRAIGAGRSMPLDSRLAAYGLSALMDGLWLESCLNPDNLTAAEAVALCEAWIDATLGTAKP